MNDVYCGPAPLPETLARSWNFDIPALLLCAGLVAAFAVLRPSNQRAALGGSVTLLLVLFISPLCALTAALFSARAVHHILLVVAVAPLLALAFPARPSSGSRAVSIGWIAGIHAAIFWLWHAPPVYGVAIVHPAAYWAMQLSLLGSGFWLWRRVFDMAESPGGVLVAVLGVTIQMGLLGALLTFAPNALYEAHFFTTLPFGLTPAQDQQLAGLIMWVPAALPYLAAALWRAWPLLAPSAKGAP